MTSGSPNELWVYTEFLNVYRDYVLHLQQLGIILLTAIAVIFIRNFRNQSCSFYLSIYTAFLLAVINLFAGLYIYSSMLGLILDATIKLPDLITLKTGVYLQFSLEITAFIALVVSVLFLKKNCEE